MGLNDLQLPPATLSLLYAGSLVQPGIDESPVVETPVSEPPPAPLPSTEVNNAPGAFKYLGENKKNILIVVNYDDAVHLPDDDLTFLANMLTACKLNVGDVAIFNRRNYPDMAYQAVINRLNSKKILLFGVDPVEFGMPVGFPHYQVQNLSGNVYLYSPSLAQQKDDALLKSKLWVCLRSIFGI